MTSTVFDIVGKRSIEKGERWKLKFTRYAINNTPIDLTGCAARLEIFDAMAAGTPEPILVASTETGEIVLGGALGTVFIALSKPATAGIAAANLKYKLYFTDSLGDDSLFWRGRLGLV